MNSSKQTSNIKKEEYHEHWEDDLKAARGVYGYPLILSCILSFLIVVGISYWLDASF